MPICHFNHKQLVRLKIALSLLYGVLLLPLLLQLQIPRQLVIGIRIGLLRCSFATLSYVDSLFLNRVEVCAEIEVIIHGEVFECILSDLILRLITPWEDVEIFILGILLVDALESFLSDGSFDLGLGLSEGEISEFLINKQPAWILLHKLNETSVIIHSLVLVYPLDLYADSLPFEFSIIFYDELVLVTVLQHVLDG